MISISRLIPTAGVDNVVIDTVVDFRSNTARINRTATLDGGVYINYSGVSDGDRTLTISEFVTEGQADAVFAMFSDGGPVRISIPDGVFVAAISSCEPLRSNGKLQMKILIDYRETE